MAEETTKSESSEQPYVSGQYYEEEQPAAASIEPTPQKAQDAPAESPSATAVQSPTLVPISESTDSRTVGGAVGNRAPEFKGIFNWINSEPLTMEELRGQVVLIDFWTYTCVNCIRTFPFLKQWHAKYADKGLVIVGVHAPEFDFEKLTNNVVRSAGDYGLPWPIAQDNNFGTWRAYSNRFWPAKYLVDKDGTVRYTHFGEGAYVATENQIRVLLAEAGADLSDVAVSSASDPRADSRAYTSDPATRITREIYGGYQRNSSGTYVADTQYYNGANQTRNYSDPGDHQNQFIYLQGAWNNGLETLRHARQTENFEDYIALKFFATSVNAVIDAEGGEPFEVEVSIDGRPFLPEEAGPDIIVMDGRSYFTVDEARLYEVVALQEFGGHELTLSSNSPDFAFFAFTFGAYEKGP